MGIVARIIVTPHACARGKVIGHVIVVVSTKIAMPRHLRD